MNASERLLNQQRQFAHQAAQRAQQVEDEVARRERLLRESSSLIAFVGRECPANNDQTHCQQWRAKGDQLQWRDVCPFQYRADTGDLRDDIDLEPLSIGDSSQIIRLHDGHCFTKSSIREWVASFREKTDPATSPTSREVLTWSDLQALGFTVEELKDTWVRREWPGVAEIVQWPAEQKEQEEVEEEQEEQEEEQEEQEEEQEEERTREVRVVGAPIPFDVERDRRYLYYVDDGFLWGINRREGDVEQVLGDRLYDPEELPAYWMPYPRFDRGIPGGRVEFALMPNHPSLKSILENHGDVLQYLRQEIEQTARMPDDQRNASLADLLVELSTQNENYEQPIDRALELLSPQERAQLFDVAVLNYLVNSERHRRSLYQTLTVFATKAALFSLLIKQGVPDDTLDALRSALRPPGIYQINRLASVLNLIRRGTFTFERYPKTWMLILNETLFTRQRAGNPWINDLEASLIRGLPSFDTYIDHVIRRYGNVDNIDFIDDLLRVARLKNASQQSVNHLLDHFMSVEILRQIFNSEDRVQEARNILIAKKRAYARFLAQQSQRYVTRSATKRKRED